jgi:hypothetical protein
MIGTVLVFSERYQHVLEKPARAGLGRIFGQLFEILHRDVTVARPDRPDVDAAIARARNDGFL